MLRHSPVEEHPRLARAAVESNPFVRQSRGQPLGNPVSRVVILAENDAADIEPAAFMEEIEHGIQLRVGRLTAQQCDDPLEVDAFLVDDSGNILD